MSSKQFGIEDIDVENLPLENVVEIDLDTLNEDSQKEAHEMLDTVSKLFVDDNFRKAHPQAQKRI